MAVLNEGDTESDNNTDQSDWALCPLISDLYQPLGPGHRKSTRFKWSQYHDTSKDIRSLWHHIARARAAPCEPWLASAQTGDWSHQTEKYLPAGCGSL